MKKGAISWEMIAWFIIAIVVLLVLLAIFMPGVFDFSEVRNSVQPCSENSVMTDSYCIQPGHACEGTTMEGAGCPRGNSANTICCII